MEILLAFTKVDGLESDGARILGKGSLQEVEIVSVVPVCRFYVKKELMHTPIYRQVHLKQTRIPTIWVASSTPSASDKYLTYLSYG